MGFSVCAVDPLESVIGAFPMSENRSLDFGIFADLICVTHAHQQHGDSSIPLSLVRIRLRIIRISFFSLADALCSLCESFLSSVAVC